MRQRLAATISVATQKQGVARPDGVGHAAPRPHPCYRTGRPSSRPQAGPRLALGRRGLRRRPLPRYLHLDPAWPDRRRVALGQVRRGHADRTVRGRPPDRPPGPRARRPHRRDLPGVPEALAGLDRRVGRGAGGGAAPPYAGGSGRPVPGGRLRRLRRRWQSTGVAPDALQRGPLRVPAQGAAAPCPGAAPAPGPPAPRPRGPSSSTAPRCG